MKKFNKIKALFVVALAVISTGIQAADNKKAGTAGAQELLIPVGARMIALSGSDISNVKGIEAFYWNPAGLSLLSSGVEATVYTSKTIADIGVNYLAIASSFGDVGTFSFSLKSLDFGDIPVTTTGAPDGTGETYSPSFITTSVGYANLLTDRIRVGVNFNIISESIVRTNATGVSLDAGIQYSNLGNINGLGFGVVLKNLGPSMKYNGSDLLKKATATGTLRGEQLYAIDAASYELPSNFQMSLSYNFSVDDQQNLLFSGLFESNNTSNDTYRGSIEYGFSDMFFVRGSYLATPDEATNYNLWGSAFGAGFKYDLGFLKFNFDYAYRSVQYFDGIHSIGMSFGL